jgi:hypothetical protein
MSVPLVIVLLLVSHLVLFYSVLLDANKVYVMLCYCQKYSYMPTCFNIHGNSAVLEHILSPKSIVFSNFTPSYKNILPSQILKNFFLDI